MFPRTIPSFLLDPRESPVFSRAPVILQVENLNEKTGIFYPQFSKEFERLQRRLLKTGESPKMFPGSVPRYRNCARRMMYELVRATMVIKTITAMGSRTCPRTRYSGTIRR